MRPAITAYSSVSIPDSSLRNFLIVFTLFDLKRQTNDLITVPTPGWGAEQCSPIPATPVGMTELAGVGGAKKSVLQVGSPLTTSGVNSHRDNSDETGDNGVFQRLHA